MRSLFGIAVAILTILGPSPEIKAQEATGNSATILVYDVSNSMWGQIDGVSKVEIAREVIGDLLTDWDGATDLGLVAYGHRRAGDCGDIQTLIPVGPVDAKSFSATINSLVPRGKTPLSEAVRTAANELNYLDRPATVILVSDGIESCDADPCALARELERGGIGFTAHVVGFDVASIENQSQLSCLADLTGGTYLTASNASELSSALRTVTTPVTMLRLEAAETETGPALSDPDIVWTLVELDRELNIVSGDRAAGLSLDSTEDAILHGLN